MSTTMRSSSVPLLVLVCLLLPLAGHCADLLDAYQQARASDPQLSAAGADRLAVQEGVAQARAPLLPQLSATATLSQAEAHDSERSRSRELLASVSQVVVDVSRLSTLKVAQAQAGAADATYRAAQQALCVRVATAYFGVLGAQDNLAYAQANEDAYRQQVEQAEQRYRTGLAALVDLEQARAYHATARGNTISARTALADAQEALTELTGQPADALKPLRASLPMDPPTPADPQAWVDAALQNNPLLAAQRLGLDAAENLIAAARGQHLPTLSAGLDVGRQATWSNGAGPLQDGRTPTTATLGLTLRVPLFAGGATQSRVRQAVYQRDASREQLEARRRQLSRDTLLQYRAVLAGIAQMRAASEAVEAAGKALAATRSGQALGTRSMTDLLLAIQTLTAAQGALSQSRTQFVLSQLLLKQAAGALDEADLAAVNTLLQ